MDVRVGLSRKLSAKEQEQLGNHHDYYIFGHRHIELDLMLSHDSRIMILGDCWKQFTYAQLDEQGIIVMNNYDTPKLLNF